MKKLDVRVVVVTFQSGPIVEAYVRDTRLEWPILIDSPLEVYQAYGMNRGHWWSIFGPPAWWSYVKLLLRGRRLRMPSGNVSQLGGNVLVDPKGIVRSTMSATGQGTGRQSRHCSTLCDEAGIEPSKSVWCTS